MQELVPLYKAISKLGYGSRTQAQGMILAGEISVAGKTCLDPEMLVSIDNDKIYHKGIMIQADNLKVIVLYKPKGIITSRKDEQNRPTVYSLLPIELHKLHCVGRLDFATSGLLLLTNNTLLSSWLTDPKNGIHRVYVVTVRGLVTEQKAEQMRQGIVDNNDTLKSDTVIVRKSSNRESHLVLTLSEGKNREIRRMCSSIGNEVTKLKRVAYGSLTLDNLQPGHFRELGKEEIVSSFPGIHNFVTL